MHCPHFIPSTWWMDAWMDGIAAVVEMRKYETFKVSPLKPAGTLLFR